MFTIHNTFFTSDHHFGHKNIIRYSSRPFASVEAMDAAMIERWNAVIGPQDHVFHLGDVSLHGPERTAELLSRLNGHIYLLQGNHDKSATDRQCRGRFEWTRDLFDLRLHDEDEDRRQYIVLCHYAMRVWNRSFHGAWHLYGHSHGTLGDDPCSLSFDIGVDCHDFRPLSYAEVKAIMARKQPRRDGPEAGAEV